VNAKGENLCLNFKLDQNYLKLPPIPKRDPKTESKSLDSLKCLCGFEISGTVLLKPALSTNNKDVLRLFKCHNENYSAIFDSEYNLVNLPENLVHQSPHKLAL
jgi:hypothetical protein